jgi:hypothetical protein
VKTAIKIILITLILVFFCLVIRGIVSGISESKARINEVSILREKMDSLRLMSDSLYIKQREIIDLLYKEEDRRDSIIWKRIDKEAK